MFEPQKKSLSYLPKLSRLAGKSCGRRPAPSGAVCPEPSPTPMATCGKSRTTRVGPSRMTGPPVSDILLSAGDQYLTASLEGSRAISAALGRGRRCPARPAAYVDGEYGPQRGEAWVAIGEQRQGAYALGVL